MATWWTYPNWNCFRFGPLRPAVDWLYRAALRGARQSCFPMTLKSALCRFATRNTTTGKTDKHGKSEDDVESHPAFVWPRWDNGLIDRVLGSNRIHRIERIGRTRWRVVGQFEIPLRANSGLPPGIVRMQRRLFIFIAFAIKSAPDRAWRRPVPCPW